MYGYAKENRIKTHSFGCKIVREHNDLEFDDNGVHLVNETSRGDHPIMTYTMGLTRNLKFRWHSKEKNETKSQWRPVSDSKEELKLHNSSIMVLLTDDEKPKEIDGMLYKTKHSASFSGDGISIGFVFRSIKRNSVSTFFETTGEWAPEHDCFLKTTAECWRKGKCKNITKTRTSQLRKKKDVVWLCSILEKKKIVIMT